MGAASLLDPEDQARLLRLSPAAVHRSDTACSHLPLPDTPEHKHNKQWAVGFPDSTPIQQPSATPQLQAVTQLPGPWSRREAGGGQGTSESLLLMEVVPILWLKPLRQNEVR